MAKLKIRWTETAVVEFSRMLTFYDVRNGNAKNSRSIVKMVRDSLKLVVKFPKMFHVVNVKELPDVRVFRILGIQPQKVLFGAEYRVLIKNPVVSF